MTHDEYVLPSQSLISSNHVWLCRQEYANGTGLQLKSLLTLKRDSLSTNTAHVRLNSLLEEEACSLRQPMSPERELWKPAPGCLYTLCLIHFFPLPESLFAIINRNYECNCLRVLGVNLVGQQKYGWS